MLKPVILSLGLIRIRGLPCGSERFVRKLEAVMGINLSYRPQGRLRKENKGSVPMSLSLAEIVIPACY